MEGTLQFLGTGGSMGIPVIGCDCLVCRSSDVRNRRLRTSALLKIGGRTVLIDAGPDFRQQALQVGFKHLDGVILTHAHYDHIGGLDELRTFFLLQKHPIPCLTSEATFHDIKKRYYYLFEQQGYPANLIARFDFHVLAMLHGTSDFLDLPLTYTSYHQGGMQVTGFRLGTLAYVSDICEYDSEVIDYLKGAQTLVVSALRHEPSQVHFTVDQAIAFARSLEVKQTYLVHMAHELEHETTNSQLPSGVELAYDGLEIDVRIDAN